MYKISHKDFACLMNILESITKIKQYSDPFNDADSFYADSKSFDAVRKLNSYSIVGY